VVIILSKKQFEDFYKNPENVNKYDQLRFNKSSSIFWDFLEKRFVKEVIFRYSTHRFIRSVLDIGCGTGRLILFLSNILPRAEMFGGDISNEMLSLLKIKAKKANKKITLLNLNILDIKSKRKFDLITAFRVIFHFENYNPPIAEVSKIINPGGLFIFDINNKYSLLRPIAQRHNKLKKIGAPTYYFSLSRLKKDVRKHGFDFVRAFPIKSCPIAGVLSSISPRFAFFIERLFSLTPFYYFAYEYIIVLRKK